MIGMFTTAEFYRKADRSAVVDINRVVDGHRSRIITFAVKTKKEARELAKRYGAVCWNF